MTTDYRARPNTVPWPPLVYIVAVALSIALNIVYPLPWFHGLLGDILFAAGWLAVLGAIALYVSALQAMRRARTTILPTQAAEHLVTDGAFAVTRNPIYLAITLLMVGVGLITGIVWFLLFGVLAAFATQKLAVEREEKHLETRFGKRYRDYTKRVRRWI
ncbi:protein-S-isoprenylcysteine O-methyltransferase Ste14 [Pseudaminobacter salicylatoxidans]|uniref:Protein-S-isoprenylcysteine O-methyltransferase Ste14 n=1 Tax=Pseudaminobacter salicylatoxidans TaxID=93369 RepID=A0A316BVR4_PSESE|nr:isoprenylcysteine carboxylmethyltransferase family protein [Pseudaminobacter salicylatoxidans]PWJ77678.1 protein-S-isoprenylcysteine O-methyltransferase Ste14 [Pseudaminobacter salicylatoxidans]